MSFATKNLTLALEKIPRLDTSVPSRTSVSKSPAYDSKLFRPYCWIDGFCMSRKRNSASSKAPKKGHKREATAINMMGGSDVGLLDVVDGE